MHLPSYYSFITYYMFSTNKTLAHLTPISLSPVCITSVKLPPHTRLLNNMQHLHTLPPTRLSRLTPVSWIIYNTDIPYLTPVCLTSVYLASHPHALHAYVLPHTRLLDNMPHLHTLLPTRISCLTPVSCTICNTQIPRLTPVFYTICNTNRPRHLAADIT